MGLLFSKDKEASKKLVQLHGAVKNSFSHVRRDVSNAFEWMGYLNKRFAQQEQQIEQMNHYLRSLDVQSIVSSEISSAITSHAKSHTEQINGMIKEAIADHHNVEVRPHIEESIASHSEDHLIPKVQRAIEHHYTHRILPAVQKVIDGDSIKSAIKEMVREHIDAHHESDIIPAVQNAVHHHLHRQMNKVMGDIHQTIREAVSDHHSTHVEPKVRVQIRDHIQDQVRDQIAHHHESEIKPVVKQMVQAHSSVVIEPKVRVQVQDHLRDHLPQHIETQMQEHVERIKPVIKDMVQEHQQEHLHSTIREVLDDYYSFKEVIGQLDQLRDRISEVSSRASSTSGYSPGELSDIKSRLHTLESRKVEIKRNLKEKLLKKITRNSKDYIKSIIHSLIRKYGQVSGLQLKEMVVDEQGLCSKSSFYRLLAEIESEDETINMVREGKEKTYFAKTVKPSSRVSKK